MNQMTKTFRLTAPLVAVAVLAGCTSSFAPQEPVQPPGIEPLPTAAQSGLAERKPDLCKASTYKVYIGQPGSVIPTLGITRAYRVVEYRGIEEQIYDPNRVVFRLDENGAISAVDCG